MFERFRRKNTINQKIRMLRRCGKGVHLDAGTVITHPGNIEIGDYAWVGARSVVTRDVPAMAVVGGNPAAVLKYRNREVYEKLKDSDSGYICHCK